MQCIIVEDRTKQGKGALGDDALDLVLIFSISGYKMCNVTLREFESQYCKVAKVAPSQQIAPDPSPIIKVSLTRHLLRERCHHPGDRVCG